MERVADASSRELRPLTLLLECFDQDSVTVHFEPAGAVHVLERGDWFNVQANVPVDFEIEVAHAPEAIIVQLGAEWGVRAFDRAGNELRL